ncbi:hypothetical protein B0H11DRAFT_2039523 [Mycena galericulata]|nr:hypothetical protein B0H11DRAFT_2039523 [Mycena galericulata]
MPSAFHVRKLDPATALRASEPGSLPEMGAIESVLGKAFAGDVFTAVVTGHDPKADDMSYIGPFWGSTVVAGLLGGEVWVAETGNSEKKIIGCAVWFGPGHTMYDSEDQQKHVLGPLMAGFTDELKHWWLATFLPQYEVVLTSALGEGTKHNSWHLQTLAVDPEYQRKGAARSLVNAIVEKASQTGSMLCVEVGNETNLEIYGKLGFVIMPKGKARDDSKAVYTGLDGNTFSMWVMARDIK